MRCTWGRRGRAVHGFALAARHYFDTPFTSCACTSRRLLIGMIKGSFALQSCAQSRAGAGAAQRGVGGDGGAGSDLRGGGGGGARHAAGPEQQASHPRFVPAYLELAPPQLREEYREDLATLGLNIFTPFDPLLQRQLKRAPPPCWSS